MFKCTILMIFKGLFFRINKYAIYCDVGASRHSQILFHSGMQKRVLANQEARFRIKKKKKKE